MDRTDPSKNVVRGFLAFGALLDQHPELSGKVSFLALLQPSRTDVAEYSDYIATIGAVVAEINARHTRHGQQPIDLRMVEDFPLAVAAYSICDVLMVNALADGMNLVAKEVPVVNRRNGVLALSENTGAHEELGDFAVTLYPFDIQQMADALYEALTMPRRRAGAAPGRRRASRCGSTTSRPGCRRSCGTSGRSAPTCRAGQLESVRPHAGSPARIGEYDSGDEGVGVADSSGPHGQVGAWISVFIIVAAFVIGVFAMIDHNSPVLWIIAAVVLVIGGIGALASRIMELGH